MERWTEVPGVPGRRELNEHDMKQIVFCLCLLVLCGCRSYKVAESSHEAAVRRDTVFAVRERTDSVYFRDSVIVKEAVRGDTVYVEKTAWKTRYKTSVRTDTVYVARTDSVKVKETVRETKYRKLDTVLFIIAVFWCFLLVIVFYLLSKKI